MQVKITNCNINTVINITKDEITLHGENCSFTYPRNIPMLKSVIESELATPLSRYHHPTIVELTAKGYRHMYHVDPIYLQQYGSCASNEERDKEVKHNRLRDEQKRRLMKHVDEFVFWN